MIYPLVRELAGEGVPLTVTCRVLKMARQPYYRGLDNPVSNRAWVRAHQLNDLVDANRAGPEDGYRLLRNEAEQGGWSMKSSNSVAVDRLATHPLSDRQETAWVGQDAWPCCC